MTDSCGKRPLQGLGTCTRVPGHLGDHHDIHLDSSWPNHSDRKSNPSPKSSVRSSGLKRTRGVRAVSDKQKDNLELWAIIKKAMIIAQVRTTGYRSCMVCRIQNPDSIDLDHIDGRDWTPENAQLLCRACHDRKHGTVEWSGAS